MRKFIIIFFLISSVCTKITAGDFDRYYGIQTGVLYPRIYNIVASYEKEKLYHNAIEYYFEYATQWNKCKECNKVCFDSFWKEHYSYAIGTAYKFPIKRGKNHYTRIRIGADVGATDRSFAFGLEAGFEYVYIFRNNMQFVIHQKNEVTFFNKPRFKNGLLVGLKLPL